MPRIKDIKWQALFLSVDFPELFISARTPATAMYMNPPAVNPSINDDCPGSFPQTKTNAVPASATSAERKLKKSAFVTVKPDLTRIPKSPISWGSSWASKNIVLDQPPTDP